MWAEMEPEGGVWAETEGVWAKQRGGGGRNGTRGISTGTCGMGPAASDSCERRRPSAMVPTAASWSRPLPPARAPPWATCQWRSSRGECEACGVRSRGGAPCRATPAPARPRPSTLWRMILQTAMPVLSMAAGPPAVKAAARWGGGAVSSRAPFPSSSS